MSEKSKVPLHRLEVIALCICTVFWLHASDASQAAKPSFVTQNANALILAECEGLRRGSPRRPCAAQSTP